MEAKEKRLGVERESRGVVYGYLTLRLSNPKAGFWFDVGSRGRGRRGGGGERREWEVKGWRLGARRG